MIAASSSCRPCNSRGNMIILYIRTEQPGDSWFLVTNHSSVYVCKIFQTLNCWLLSSCAPLAPHQGFLALVSPAMALPSSMPSASVSPMLMMASREGGGRNARLSTLSSSSPHRVPADQYRDRKHIGGRDAGTPAGGEIWASVQLSAYPPAAAKLLSSAEARLSRRACSQSGHRGRSESEGLPGSCGPAFDAGRRRREASGDRSSETVASLAL